MHTKYTPRGLGHYKEGSEWHDSKEEVTIHDLFEIRTRTSQRVSAKLTDQYAHHQHLPHYYGCLIQPAPGMVIHICADSSSLIRCKCDSPCWRFHIYSSTKLVSLNVYYSSTNCSGCLNNSLWIVVMLVRLKYRRSISSLDFRIESFGFWNLDRS